MPSRSHSEPSIRPSFVSTQVTEARRYYLDLNPNPSREIVVVCGGCERLRSDYVVERKSFPYLAIEFVAEGEGSLELAGRSYRLRAGMAFAYGPSVPHLIRNEPGRPMLKYYLDFAGIGSRRLLTESPLGRWEAVQLSAPQELTDLFELLQREGASESRFAPKICAALVPLMIMKITERAVRYGSVEPRALETYQRARRVVERDYVKLRSAEAAAKACHLDPAYFSRLFRRFAHTTPYQFLMKLKMNRAAELLLDERMLVKEAAAELEFSDAFHFSRAFKRIYGISPDQFAKRSGQRR
jgi:AraC-like DNA-binding protein